MKDEYSDRRLSPIIIGVLSILLLIVSILYFAERGKYANAKEKLDSTNMYLYQIEVESPLRGFLNYLGVQQVEDVDWEELDIQEIASKFSELERGLENINAPNIEGIPEETLIVLQTLQDKIKLINIQTEKTLDENTKEEIMNLTKNINTCEVSEFNRSWEQITSEIKCLNNEI
ncbi:hypothetical protein SAMN05216389_11868 [Oceanobacillus limi]|uniref:Uncharacterized protein n=1 Tax=Oceanobacillus limi TaxID=930131 RepID=A0A1I0G4T6_9BACI|nr:hypothetical protein [Oceanobacillus limi]SET64882.1 hypothetical protein SAMN05216389_11868 [Oceanobacillus limi]